MKKNFDIIYEKIKDVTSTNSREISREEILSIKNEIEEIEELRKTILDSTESTIFTYTSS